MFQYNLKSLLLFMLAVCLLTWLLFVLPGEIGVVVLMCLLAIFPSAVVAGILYFRGIPQAFAIGCVPPIVVIGCLMVFSELYWRIAPSDAIQMKIIILVFLLIILGGGGASAGIRMLATWSRQPQVETKTFPGLPIDVATVARPADGSAGASPSRRLTPDP